VRERRSDARSCDLAMSVRTLPSTAALPRGLTARWPELAVAAIVLASFALTAAFTSRVTEWLVMTDEMQYAKLALAIARDGSLLPHLHGVYYPSLNQLYPLVQSPVFGLLDMPEAFRVAHVLNAFLMATAAIPAYGLGRAVVGSRAGGLAAAALTAFVPWMAMSAGLVTEVVGYPALVWALWAMQRGVADPSPRGDVVAGVALLVAFFARTQYVVLVIAYPLAVIVHEAGFALAAATPDRRGALRPALRHCVRRHVVLWVAVGVALVAVVPLALQGRLATLLGQYAGAAHGDLLPAGVPRSIALHVDLVAVGLGVLPAVLAVGWALGTLVRPSTKPLHAFAVLAAVTATGFAVQVASYSVRLVGGAIQTRYIVPLVPLFIVGAVACCLDARRRWPGVLVAAVALAAAVGLRAWGPVPSPWFASPDTAWHIVLYGRVSQLEQLTGIGPLSLGLILRWATVLVGILLALALRRLPPRVTLAGVTALVLAYGIAETAYVLNGVTGGPNGERSVSSGTLAGRDWIDRAVPGERVALMPIPITGAPLGLGAIAYFSQTLWFDQEFWNKAVDQAYAWQGADPYTPFPKPVMHVDPGTGRLVVDDQRRFVVQSVSDLRFGLRGARERARTADVRLLDVPRPYRVDWATSGVDPLGGPATSARIRLYGGVAAQLRRVSVEMVPDLGATGAQRYVLRSAQARTRGTLRIGDVLDTATSVCVPAGGHADVTLRWPRATAPPPVKLRTIRVHPAGRC